MRGNGFTKSRTKGFTLIELIVVMAIVALLVSIVAPRYFRSVDNAREASLRTSLNVMRDALDKYVADKGSYPSNLQTLVKAGYLRKIPVDPLTERSDSWQMLPPADDDVLLPLGDSAGTGMADVRSGAKGTGQDGIAYDQW